MNASTMKYHAIPNVISRIWTSINALDWLPQRVRHRLNGSEGSAQSSRPSLSLTAITFAVMS
jgi:hypothetical protein